MDPSKPTALWHRQSSVADSPRTAPARSNARRDDSCCHGSYGELVCVLLALAATIGLAYYAASDPILLGLSSSNTTAVGQQNGSSAGSSATHDSHVGCVDPAEQYRNYLQQLVSARVVRIAAKSKSSANANAEVCGAIALDSQPHSVSDNTTSTYDVSGAFDVRTSDFSLLIQTVLHGNKGFQRLTTPSNKSVGGTQLVHSGCLHQSEVPRLALLPRAASSARWVAASAPTQAATCNQVLAFTFEGEPYVVEEQHLDTMTDSDETLCLRREQQDESLQRVLRVESADVIMYLALLGDANDDADGMRGSPMIEAIGSRDSVDALLQCPELATTLRVPLRSPVTQLDSVVTVRGDTTAPPAKLRGVPQTESRHDQVVTAAALFDTSAECACKHGSNKTCLFVHGIGVHDDVGVQDTFEDYWGKHVKTALPCCAVVKFTHFDTVGPPWFSRDVSRELCRAAIAVSQNKTLRVNDTQLSSSTTSASALNATSVSDPDNVQHRANLKNMVVIAHSTGNLHLASALLHGDCALDRATSRWIAIQGPMFGTRTANRVIAECQRPNSTWDDLAREVLTEFELCPITGSTKSLVLAHTKDSGSCLDTLYDRAAKVFRARVDAVMCGVSPTGIVSTSSPRFVALAKFSNHSSELNDGAVEFASCRAGLAMSAFNGSVTSRLYRAEINHDDGRMIHGDGLWGSTRKPLKWLQCQF